MLKKRQTQKRSKRIPGKLRFFRRLEPLLLSKDYKKLVFAYELTKYAFRTKNGDRKRDDGVTRAFEHAKAVVLILMKELGIIDWRILSAGMCHDNIEDSYLFDEEIMAVVFGEEVVLWVKMLSKKPKNGYYERLKKYAPWQVLLIKCSDQLHNLRTLGSCRPEKRKKTINQFYEIDYLGILEKLGRMLPDDNRWVAGHLRREMLKEVQRYEGV